MKLVKRTRTSRPKLQKGQTALGGEFYFSKKPSQRQGDYVQVDAKAAATSEKSIRVKRK